MEKDMNKFKDYMNEEKYPWESYWVGSNESNPIFKMMGEGALPYNVLMDNTGKIINYNSNVFYVLKNLNIAIPKVYL